jgi:hypothetical protein
MPRPRTPTAVLAARGSFDKNPQRLRDRENEPESAGSLGEPPPEFMIQEPDTGYQEAERLRKIWYEIAEEGPWISRSSRGTVKTLCRIANQLPRVPLSKLPAFALAEDKLRTSLGLTEASRSRVNAPPKTAESTEGSWQNLAEEGSRPRLAQRIA